MLTPPNAIIPILQPFSTLFQRRTWMKVQVLLVGVILAPRKRAITSALRVMGLSDYDGFAKYHHVLNRATWSSLRLSRVLVSLLIQRFDHGDGPLVFGIDETIERRRGRRIKARGIYRDGARSSRSHFVKASGLRWISLMWLTTIPWARRTWALPVLTALAPSERYCQKMGRPHKRITDWARQMILQLRRWLPDRPIVVVADSSYAALDLLHFCQSMVQPVTLITRLRLDAALYEPAPRRLPGQMGASTSEGPATAHAQRTPQSFRHALVPGVGRMVQQRYPYGGTQLSHRALVSQRQAACAHSLGSHSRSTQAVPLPGSAVHRSFGIPHADP